MKDQLPAQSGKHNKPPGVEVKVVNDGTAISVGLVDGAPSMRETFGTENKATALLLFNQMMGAMSRSEDIEVTTQRISAILPVLRAINPQDEIEALLATQMVGVHCITMEMMSQVMKSGVSPEQLNNSVNQVTKLTRTFTTQLEALNKHRGKQQKMRVEHVHVNNGGQAVIGSVEQGGGGIGK
ncbi:MAG: hypothetical protein ACI8PB_000069 [Desulforhopalus sp.]|jgi:hypothetical protein